MEAILNDDIADFPWDDPGLLRLPGTRPLDPRLWLIRDDAFGPQMTLRDRLIAERPSIVVAAMPGAGAAMAECLDAVLDAVRQDPGYAIGGRRVARPDGVTVDIDRQRPLTTMGRLVQSDICILQAAPEGHVLAAGILCFPARWTLSEKLGRALPGIHAPIKDYDADIARRVQRLFDGIRPGRPLWRMNALLFDDPSLFQPARENERQPRRGNARYLRSERQTLLKLPRTGAVVFGIQTRVIDWGKVPEARRRAFDGILRTTG